MSDSDSETTEDLAKVAKEFISEIRTALIDGIATLPWRGSHGLFELIAKAAVVRQHEGFDAIVDLVMMKRGDAAMALLRPACEEFIVLKYLMTIDRKDAEALLILMAQRDIDRSLTAQFEFGGPEVMESLGLTAKYAFRVKARPFLERDLKKLKAKLKWARGDVPSVWHMATVAGEQRTYKYLYHATSRSVHFSTAELMRRGWGRPGHLVLTSNHFERYWARFALSWGVQLYVDTINIIKPMHPAEDLEDAIAERISGLAKRLGRVGIVPIITADELDWSEDS